MPSAADSDSGRRAIVGDAPTAGRTPAEEAAATAQTLADTLTQVLGSVSVKLAELEVYGQQDRENIVDLKTYNKRSRHILIGLGISLVMDISLSIVTILLGLGLAQQNSIQHESLLSACQDGNVTRAAELDIWKKNILDFNNTAAGASFIRQVEVIYAPVNCAKRYRS